LAPKQGFSLNNSVKNQGAFLACRFQVAFVLSPTTNYDDPGAIAISGTRTVSSLAAGNTSSATTSLTVPSATPPGNYHVCAKADSTNNDLETNENNNTLCTVSTIQVSEPDLHMTSVNPNSSTANQGGTLSVSDTVENQGVVAAGSFRIGYHLSKDTVFGGDDIVISTTRTVTALVAGASNTATTSLSIPSNAPGGTYYLCAMADSVNQVAETDETNNSLCSGATVTLPSADLVMTALSTATTVIAPGKTLPVSNSVKNQAGFSAGSFAIGFYLSVNADGSTQDVAITATRTLSALAAGATSTASTTLTIPAATPFGTYYVCAVADSGHTVAESDEGNNTLCTGSTIQVTLPDLSMTDVTPNAATAVKGGTLSVTTTVSNGGAASGAFRIGFYLSVNADGSTQDVAITAIRSVGSLGAGASSTGTTSLTIPGATPSLSYYVCAIADSLNQVVETDEGNNTLCSGSQVNVQ
jgi:subtilase family serine protease